MEGGPMKQPITAALLAFALTAALPLAAQDAKESLPAAAPQAAPQMDAETKAMMDAWTKAGTPGDQHKQLAEQFAGDWTTKMTMWMDPSAPPMVETGKSVNTPVFGGRQVRMDFTGQFMGQPFEG